MRSIAAIATIAAGVALHLPVASASPLRGSTVAGTLNGEPVTVEEVDAALSGDIERNWREMKEIVGVSARAICQQRAVSNRIAEAGESREEWLARLWVTVSAEQEEGAVVSEPDAIHLRRVSRYRALEAEAMRASLNGQFALAEADPAHEIDREPVLGKVVATCLGEPISGDSVDAFASFPLYRRRAGTVRTICRQFEIDYSNPLVLFRMAKQRGVSVEALIASSSQGLEPVTDEEVAAAALAQYGNTEPASVARARLVLDTMATAKLRSAFIEEVVRSTQGSCKLKLPPPPVVQLAPARPEATISGEASGLRVVYFGGFDCQHCAAGWRSLVELRRRWTDRIRIEFRHHFPDARLVAFDQALEASCSADQGRLWEYGAWRMGATKGQAVISVADELGLSPETLRACLEDPRTAVRVLSDVQEALRVGLRDAIPSYVMGRRPRIGIQRAKLLDATIESELQSATRVRTESSAD